MPISPTLPGDEYELRISDAMCQGARMFGSRKELVRHCAALLPPSPRVAEVGVFAGDFSAYLREALSPQAMHLIDTFAVGDHVRGCFTADTHYEFVRQRFAGDGAVSLHRGLSWDALRSLPGDLDYVYIDADHSYESVKQDIDAAVSKLSQTGGIIQFNDYSAFCPYGPTLYGVLDAVNEFIEAGGVHLVGLSIDRSGMHDLAVRVLPRVGPESPRPPPKLTIITPCSRPANLPRVRESIDFTMVDAWYIVYDTNCVAPNQRCFPDDPKIRELDCDDDGAAGHPQRNAALNLVDQGLVYFLDDDNTVHPNFWNIAKHFQPGHVYTFDCQRVCDVLLGNCPRLNYIDTSQFVFDVGLLAGQRFVTHSYNADGMFIEQLCFSHPDRWVYVPGIAATHNSLAPRIPTLAPAPA